MPSCEPKNVNPKWTHRWRDSTVSQYGLFNFEARNELSKLRSGSRGRTRSSARRSRPRYRRLSRPRCLLNLGPRGQSVSKFQSAVQILEQRIGDLAGCLLRKQLAALAGSVTFPVDHRAAAGSDGGGGFWGTKELNGTLRCFFPVPLQRRRHWTCGQLFVLCRGGGGGLSHVCFYLKKSSICRGVLQMRAHTHIFI